MNVCIYRSQGFELLEMILRKKIIYMDAYMEKHTAQVQ